jgi:prepilin-type N-terminal cleavage/methylation domain-containing protein
VAIGGLAQSPCPAEVRSLYLAELCGAFPEARFWALAQASAPVVNGLGRLGLLDRVSTDGAWWIHHARCEQLAVVEDGLLRSIKLTHTGAQSFFTLPELIVTLALIGILAVFVAPKFTGMNAVRSRSEYDKVLSAITYARKAAVAQRRYACVSVSGTTVTLTIDANPPESTATPFGGTCPFVSALNLPSSDAACSAANQTCLQYSTISSVPGTFQFDALGRASATVTITMAGYPPIAVEGETGHVH